MDLLRSVAISFLHFRLGSTHKLCLGVSWVVFVSVSDHEVRKQPIQPRGWTGLLMNCEVLVVRCSVANARTLQCQSCKTFPASPIERIHRHDSPGMFCKTDIVKFARLPRCN